MPTLVGRSYTVREAGYAYLYISNEQVMQTDVYFDDVKFTYTPTNVLQYTEFYSHGAPNAQSWTRENTTANNFLGNGGTELNPTTSLYDLHYRNYDPVLGRMNQIDPVADKYGSVTPYNYAFNSPVNLNDPMGDDPPFFNRELWKGNVRGAVYNNRGIEGHENSRSLSLGGWGAQYNSAAMNFGLMSTNQFVNFYGVNQMSGREKASFAQGFSVNKGGGISGLINASLYFSGTNGNTQGADPFTFSIGKKNFGGVYHTTNNKITSLTYGPVIDAGNGNWLESSGDIVLEDFENNGTCPSCAGNSWTDWAGIILDAGDDLMRQVGQNFRALQVEVNSLRAGTNFGKEIGKVNTATTTLKWAGRGLGAYNAFNIEAQYRNGQIGSSSRVLEQGTNVFSTFG